MRRNMLLSINALGMGYKHAARVIQSGRLIPANLETCFRNRDMEKARLIADPDKIDKAYQMVFKAAEEKIASEEKRNWYFWAKPRGRKTSPDLGAENVFKEFYEGNPLTEEEKKIVLGVLAIQIEEELDILKKERDAVRR